MSPEQIAQDDKDLTELYANSRPHTAPTPSPAAKGENALHEIVTNGVWNGDWWCVRREVYDLAYNADLLVVTPHDGDRHEEEPMPLRIIVRTDDAGMACNVGGEVLSEFKTFDVDLPELEKFLREVQQAGQTRFSHRQVVGVEIMDEDGPYDRDGYSSGSDGW